MRLTESKPLWITQSRFVQGHSANEQPTSVAQEFGPMVVGLRRSVQKWAARRERNGNVERDANATSGRVSPTGLIGWNGLPRPNNVDAFSVVSVTAGFTPSNMSSPNRSGTRS